MKGNLLVWGIIGIALLALAGTCSAAYGDRELVDGNPTCEDFGCTGLFKVDPPVSGTYTSGDFQVTVTFYASIPDGDIDSVDWTSNSPVTKVIVKGGNKAYVYTYPSGSMGDTGLIAPDTSSQKPAAISHVDFCAGSTVVPEFPAWFLPTLCIAGLSAVLIFFRKN